METIKKSYLQIKNKENHYLKVEIYYYIGGYNYATYKHESRGYYVSVTPIERVNHEGYSTESYACFSGYKALLKEVARKSNKAVQEALKLAENVINEIVEVLCNKNGFELE